MPDWRTRICDRTLGHSADDLTPTVRSLFEDMMLEKPIDLSWVTVDQVNSMHMCVVLRATCMEKVTGWTHAFDVTKLAPGVAEPDPNLR